MSALIALIHEIGIKNFVTKTIIITEEDIVVM